MTHRRLTPLFSVLGLVAGLAAAPAAAEKPHEHGVVTLTVAIEGNQMNIDLEAPLDNLLGFERAPRTDAERKAAAEVLARLRSPGQISTLFAADAAAQCTLAKAEVLAPVLEPAARPAAGGAGDHADVDARYEFRCAQPSALRGLSLGLFDTWRRIQRIDAQVAGPQGQLKATLKRPNRSLKLVR